MTERSFNRYKSDIKFLDYGVLGIPGVYSNVGPYPASVVHEQTGLLVANQPEAWFAALSRLIEDAARSYVHAERLLRTRAVDWLSAIDDLHRQTQSRPSQACR